MKKILIILALLFSINLFSQYDYKEKVIYKFKGNDSITCDTIAYPIKTNNSYGDPVVTGYYQKCKMLTWTQEYYSGNIVFWFNGKWHVELGDGKFWKCEWIDFINLLTTK